jgi:predicted transcriptional regulator
MDPDVIRRIKAAAALRDKTASYLLEEAARDWLDRHQDGKK